MEQTQDFPVATDELWQAISDPEQMSWLGDEVELDLQPGGRGRVVDDGERRQLVIDEIEAGRHLSFHWWPEDDDRQVSRVDLIVVPRPDGSRLVVRETLASQAAVGRWALRTTLLALTLTFASAPIAAVGHRLSARA